MVKEDGQNAVSPCPDQKPLQGSLVPQIEKTLKSNIARTENSTVFQGKMPLLAVFWLASGLSTVLVDPPGLTARSSTACHAPRTPTSPSEGTLRPCGHCAKRLSHSVLGSNCLLSVCFNVRIGQLRCLQTHLGVSFPLHAMPCPHSPRVLRRKALHVRSGHCATMHYPLFYKVGRLLRLWFV